jgi:formyltetrahydrofolate-dependent phosphoribosylglycinamide formyltransferase
LLKKKIISEINNKKIKLICLAGFMRILSKNFIKRFKGKILNIHPSLLPKYKGLNTHQRAISNNEKYSGCTVHFVNSRLDSGKIILQKKVKINKGETAVSLAKKILIQEHKLYPKAISKVFNL